MRQDLEARIAEIGEVIDDLDDAKEAEALDHLEEAALSLETMGAPVPAWVRARLAARQEAEIEDGFDNMPI